MPKLNELLTKNKRFGEGFVRPTAVTHMDYPRIMTNIFPLDFALAGGVPVNAISQFYGPPQGGKTTLSYLLAKALKGQCMNAGCMKPLQLCKCQEPGIRQAVHVSLEASSPDALWLSRLGFSQDDISSFLYAAPEYGEQAGELVFELVKADDVGLIIIDSIANMVPLSQLQAPLEDIVIGRQSLLVKRFIQSLTYHLQKEFDRGHYVAVVLINQIRSIIGASRNAPDTGVTGGYALKHGYRMSLYLNQLGSDDKDKTDDNLRHVLKTSASLLGPSSKVQLLVMAGKAEFKIMLDGTDGYAQGAAADDFTLWKYANDIGMIVKAGKGYVIKGTDALNGGTPIGIQKQSDFFEMVKENSPQIMAIRYLLVNAYKKRFIKDVLGRNEKIMNMKGGKEDAAPVLPVS